LKVVFETSQKLCSDYAGKLAAITDGWTQAVSRAAAAQLYITHLPQE
jgi:hypothetical protein